MYRSRPPADLPNAVSVLTRCSVVLIALAGCSTEPTDDTPTGAVKLFLGAMQRAEWDSSALEDAYAVLAPDVQRQLRERAELAGALAGREFAPWHMIAQGRFRLRFAPRTRNGFQEQVRGKNAVVTVVGYRSDQRARIHLLEVGEAWRLALDLPSPRATSPR